MNETLAPIPCIAEFGGGDGMGLPCPRHFLHEPLLLCLSCNDFLPRQHTVLNHDLHGPGFVVKGQTVPWWAQ